LSFCILAIVPVALLITAHLAPTIDTILDDTIIATIRIVGLAINVCSFFLQHNHHGIICSKHYLC
jgi:hypothetical protein